MVRLDHLTRWSLTHAIRLPFLKQVDAWSLDPFVSILTPVVDVTHPSLWATMVALGSLDPPLRGLELDMGWRTLAVVRAVISGTL